MKKILLLILFLSGTILSQQELTGTNPYKAEFKKDPLNYRSLPVVFYQISDTTYWNPAHVDGLLSIGIPSVTDSNSNVLNVSVNNQPQFHYTNPNEVLAFTNSDTDTSVAVIDLQSYPYFTLQVLESGGVTLKVFISNIAGASATDPTDGNWLDYSTTLLGGATVVDTDGFYIQDTKLPALKIMIWAATSDATNDFSATIIKSF